MLPQENLQKHVTFEHVLQQQTDLDVLFSSQKILSPNFSFKQIATMQYTSTLKVLVHSIACLQPIKAEANLLELD